MLCLCTGPPCVPDDARGTGAVDVATTMGVGPTGVSDGEAATPAEGVHRQDALSRMDAMLVVRS